MCKTSKSMFSVYVGVILNKMIDLLEIEEPMAIFYKYAFVNARKR